MNWTIPLFDPDLGDEEIVAVTDVLRSKWLTMGGVTEKFERLFASKIGAKYCFAVTNGTAALHIANIALGIGSNDEVICPALTFVATANASRYSGAKVVFADSKSEQDLTIDPCDIESKITPRTKAIIVVHYAGFPCDMEAIMKIARKRRLKVIEDCAHAPLAWCKIKGIKRYVGAIGDVGCFSFFSNKNMTTGEGGMIATDNDELASKIRLLRSHGMTTLTYDRYKGHIYGYDVTALGYNYRIDEIRSALGLCQLNRLVDNNAKRRQLFQLYKTRLLSIPSIVLPFADRNLEQATPHILPIIAKNHRENTVARLGAAGIQTSKHYDLIPTFTLYKDMPFQSKISHINNIVTIPFFPGLREDQVEEICSIIRG
jgi:dTDP-4-amino-4,6-dideoxygalactose transaminase